MKLTEEHLKDIQKARENTLIMRIKAETAAVESARAVAEAKVSELIYENTLLTIYVKYELTGNHVINETTGEIHLKDTENNEKESND
ncbi:MAG: hypothetical protein Q8P20_09530 [bacterium]|nr:hypothetical protein [bacterium]